jgi:hypothetical protein
MTMTRILVVRGPQTCGSGGRAGWPSRMVRERVGEAAGRRRAVAAEMHHYDHCSLCCCCEHACDSRVAPYPLKDLHRGAQCDHPAPCMRVPPVPTDTSLRAHLHSTTCCSMCHGAQGGGGGGGLAPVPFAPASVTPAGLGWVGVHVSRFAPGHAWAPQVRRRAFWPSDHETGCAPMLHARLPPRIARRGAWDPAVARQPGQALPGGRPGRRAQVGACSSSSATGRFRRRRLPAVWGLQQCLHGAGAGQGQQPCGKICPVWFQRNGVSKYDSPWDAATYEECIDVWLEDHSSSSAECCMHTCSC